MRINRPTTTTSHNVITISHLLDISMACDLLSSPQVYRATFLLGFFAFLRLSNLVPHTRADFDHTRHLTGNDVFFTDKYLKVLIKWSKTMQTRDKVQCVTLPRLKIKLLCPFRAVKALFKLYPMSGSAPLRQIRNEQGSNPLTDSQVRKSLKTINVYLGLSLVSLHFMILGDQVPPMPLAHMYPSNRSKDMAPGLRIVFGVTSSLITLPVKVLLML